MKTFFQTTVVIIFSVCSKAYSQQNTTTYTVNRMEMDRQIERFNQYKDEAINEISFYDTAGNEVKLSSFKEKFILLDF